MQIAEVEFLAISEGADCNKARFLVQPVETPVLAGAAATFFTTVNGPWPLQWYKNDVAIPGATKASYTTDPVTAANANDTYAVEIVGCEKSTPVKAVIFTPSTKSIGVSFRGGGANGTPTLMSSNDISGLHLQAYWNNAQNAATGTVPDLNVDPTVDPLAYSFMTAINASTMSFEFASSGTWGSGTGDGSATQRMLNGLVEARPGTPGTITFWDVPAGNHTVIAYMVGIPLQFQDANYTVTGQTPRPPTSPWSTPTSTTSPRASIAASARIRATGTAPPTSASTTSPGMRRTRSSSPGTRSPRASTAARR